MSIVVSDTSPIRALHHVGLTKLLERLYGRVYVPGAVAEELRRAGPRFASFDVANYPFLIVESPQDERRVRELEGKLDRGEAAAIVLALERAADVVLIDELAGRAVARELGLKVIGVLGVLSQAKERGWVPSLRLLIERLQSELGFHLAPDLVSMVLRNVGE